MVVVVVVVGCCLDGCRKSGGTSQLTLLGGLQEAHLKNMQSRHIATPENPEPTQPDRTQETGAQYAAAIRELGKVGAAVGAVVVVSRAGG